MQKSFLILLLILTSLLLVTSCATVGDAINIAGEEEVDLSMPEQKVDPESSDDLTEKFNAVVMGSGTYTADSAPDAEAQDKAIEEFVDEQVEESDVVEVEIVEPVEDTSDETGESEESEDEEEESVGEEESSEETIDNLIIIEDGKFEPKELRIIQGQTVTWRNDDTKLHILNFYHNNPFSSDPRIDPGETFTHTFDDSGIFSYQDAILLDVMRAIIIVE